MTKKWSSMQSKFGTALPEKINSRSPEISGLSWKAKIHRLFTKATRESHAKPLEYHTHPHTRFA
jgi:hypothetical protein